MLEVYRWFTGKFPLKIKQFFCK